VIICLKCKWQREVFLDDYLSSNSDIIELNHIMKLICF